MSTLFQLFHNGTLERTFENFFDAVEYAEDRYWDAEDCKIKEIAQDETTPTDGP